MADNEHFENQDDPNRDDASRQNDNSQSDMLRPWMRTLGKKYYQNATLGKFETLDDAVDALLRRPEPKTLPESYGEDEGIEKAYKAAGLTKAEADAITAAFTSKYTKNEKTLQEVFGDKLDSVMELYDKGIGSFADDMKDRITASALDKNPDFVEIMSRVGKETGGNVFREPNPHDEKPKDPATRMVEKAYGMNKE